MDKLLGAVIGNLGPSQALLGPYRPVLSFPFPFPLPLSFPPSSPTSAPAPAPARLLVGAVLKIAYIDASDVSPGHLAESLGMQFQLVSLEVDLVFEYHKFLFEAFGVETHKVLDLEVFLQGIVVDVVLRIPVGAAPIADVTALVTVSAVLKELVNRIEAFVAKPAVGMALKAALVFGPRYIVPVALVAPQFGDSKQFVFVGKNFLVPRAQLTVHLSVSWQPNSAATTHHSIRPCSDLTWRWRSSQPKQARSQVSSGQLYRNNKVASSHITWSSYLIPRASFRAMISESLKSSKRFSPSLVNTTNSDSV